MGAKMGCSALINLHFSIARHGMSLPTRLIFWIPRMVLVKPDSDGATVFLIEVAAAVIQTSLFDRAPSKSDYTLSNNISDDENSRHDHYSRRATTTT
jgi:hypothetical protein